MVAEDAAMEHGVVSEGHCSTFIACSFHESAEQKAGRPRKCKGLWFLSLRELS